MQIIEDVLKTDKTYDNVVLTVGSFDGVHLGHQHILKDVVERAKEISGTPALLTMQPHPREYFAPDNAPNLLTSFDKKLSLLEEAGIEVVYVLPFDADTADIEPEVFIEMVLRDHCHASALIVGYDCRFGRKARGDFAMLQAFAAEMNFDVKEIAPVIVESERVSSTLIRERILQGDLETVELLLGRKYSVAGKVERGRGIGKTIGFPTANVRPYHTAIPAQGVYIAESVIDGKAYPSAVNIGIAPTIRNEDITIEAHLLDFDRDINGSEIEVLFHKRVRPEKKFSGKEALIEQIGRDVEAVRAYFG
ncbi:MAG: bifunctional riboflavin kinase/FAD synthetase [Candidatus Hydrogenedentota bacterium]